MTSDSAHRDGTAAAPDDADDRPGMWRTAGDLIGGGLATVRRGGARLLLLIVVSQFLIVCVTVPVVQWLFREALRSAGMTGLDLGQLELTGGLRLSLALIVLICVVAFWLLALQFAVLVIAADQVASGGSLSLRTLGSALARVARKLARPSSLPLVGYLFVVVPLSGFGFASALTQAIAVPPFVSGELWKTTAGTTTLLVFFAVLLYLNLRLALTVPLFALTGATGGKAVRASIRLTRGRQGWAVGVAAVAIMLIASAVGTALVLVALVPTLVTDAIAPGASPAVAAFSLGAARVAAGLLAGTVSAWIAAALVRQLHRRRADVTHAWAAAPTPASGTPSRTWVPGAIVAVVTVGTAVALGVGALAPMQAVAAAPTTLALGHRGDTSGGVENTIGSLDAAAATGVDLVEMDVMQARDGGFVVMHDANLGRLTGEGLAVKDLTTAELTAMTVRDRRGHEDTIPTLAEYVTRAAEVDMPLLIEIKLSGAETDDHVDLLVAELEELGVLERNVYHSLDAPSVARLKQLRPDLTVGYTMAFAAQEAPDTPADFIVVEQWTASEAVQRSAEARGLGFWVWTVNDEVSIRDHLRRGTGGIISDVPADVMAARAEMTGETGLAGRLYDALVRFLTVG